MLVSINVNMSLLRLPRPPLTDMVRQGLSEQEYQMVVQRFCELSMVGRVGEPADVANAVAFLLARDSGFITGQILTVDGGRTDYIGHP